MPVDGQHSVAVAVEGQAQVVVAGAYGFAQAVHVRGAAAGVDVHAVRRGAQDVHLRAAGAQAARPGDVSGAVGAVHRQSNAAQIKAQPPDQIVDVALYRHLQHFHCAEGAVAHAGHLSVQEPLDLGLFGVGELEALVAEELDAVVGVRIVRGADHDAGVGAPLQHQSRQARGGDHTGKLHAAAAAGDARHQRSLQHGPGEPRVAAQDEQRAGAAMGREHARSRAPHSHGEVGSQ